MRWIVAPTQGASRSPPLIRSAPNAMRARRARLEALASAAQPERCAARIVRHGRYVVFQLAEVAVPRALFAEILRRIDRLRGPPMAAT
jgi:hypothetical protein